MMSDESVVWHYGLMAERWGEFIHDAPELPYYQAAIKRFGEPALDPLEQSYTREVRLEKRVNGQIVATEQYTLQGNMYLKNEVLLMLQAAGFRDIAVYGDYSDQPPTAESEEINFLAVK